MSFKVFEKDIEEAEKSYNEYVNEEKPPYLSFKEYLRKYSPEFIEDNNIFGEG
jgi:hypothetical protein